MTARRVLTAAAAPLLLAPAPFGPWQSWIPALTAVVVLALTVLGGPSAVFGAAGLSLAVDLGYVGYVGENGLTLLWMPVEYAALLVLTVRAVRVLPGRRVWWGGGLGAFAAPALPLRFTLRQPAPLDASVAGLFLAAFPVAAAVGTGLYLRRQDERRARAVDDARREQRLAVARDLHDYVAHELTGILLEVQAARFAGGRDEAEDDRLLARLEAAGQRALASMDHTLDALRDPGGATPRRHALAELPELLGDSATPPELHGLAGLPALPDAVEDAAYRVVLEALTNVRRHAPAARHVTVVLAHAPGTGLTATVTDDGPAHPRPHPGGGTGLAVLRERIAALGGELAAGPEGPGWRVVARVPTGA
ncbi:sensor histidine kinase [Kitasatospora phosalacinea]|uniref:sensor histidine kinase n=1 Tax=Kitasatospora phosalacinea TaxID=2065 RepID=UPI00068D0A16|nr:histidine kinase [Kitasatospora phosalacinea]